MPRWPTRSFETFQPPVSSMPERPDPFFFINHMPEQDATVEHHHQALEIAIALSGRATHRTTAGEAPCTAGCIYAIPPGVWHAYAHCRKLDLYNCQLPAALLDGPLAWAAEEGPLRPWLKPDPWQDRSQVLTWRLPPRLLTEVSPLLTGLLDCYGRHGEPHRAELVGRLLLLLDFLARRAKPMHIPSEEPVHSAVRRAAQELRGDLVRAWSLPELAERLRINPSYLVRLFRQATGCAPMQFLARERAHQAAQLLLTTRLPVAEIGTRVGWEEPKQFARAFHRHFGRSATAFRRRMATKGQQH